MGARGMAARAAPAVEPRFDIDVLRGLVGETVFARGSAYYLEGKVEICAIDAGRVLARVDGTKTYRTEILGRGARLRLACACRAFAEAGPCKHLVATALAANDPGAAGLDPLARIRAHLGRQDAKVLIDLIVECAAADDALFRRLDLAAACGDGDGDQAAARLRQAVDGATDVPDYVGYDEVGGWAAGVRDVLDAITQAIEFIGPDAAIDLVDRAIDGIEEAIERIDDSDGLCGGLLIQARDIHLAATKLARPDPVRLAGELFAREMDEHYDTFTDAVRLYREALGEAGLAEYRRLAGEAWAAIPASSAAACAVTSLHPDQYKLFAILDSFAAADGDNEARIALRSKNLSSQFNYLELAEFCRSHGRRDEALRRAEEGLWLFEDDRPDERLACLAADLLADAGRHAEAVSLLHKTFEKAPSFKLYEQLRKTGDDGWLDRLIAVLEARPVKKAGLWHEAHGELLVRILTGETRFDAAWAAVRRHGASTPVKEALAAASGATHPAEAAAIYAARVDELVAQGDNRAYVAAAAFVARLAGLHGATAQEAYVADLKVRFGRKRNFMKLLA